LIGTTGLKVLSDLKQGLEKTGRNGDWRLSVNVPDVDFSIDAQLSNNGGITIGKLSINIHRAHSRTISNMGSTDFSHYNSTLTFRDVNANDISDTVNVSIVSINGLDAKTAGERGYISISTYDFSVLKRVERERDSLQIGAYRFNWLHGSIRLLEVIGTEKNIIVPSKIGRWQVSVIGKNAFYMKHMTNITIPNSVISIEDSAFYENDLTSITIPGSVVYIGPDAFNFNALTSITIPGSVVYIGPKAFGNNALTRVTLLEGLAFIDSEAFYFNKLTSITIPNSVTSIGDYAFHHNILTSITISNSVTSIGRVAFGANKLTSITIPNSVTSMGDYAFSGNPLVSITIPGNLDFRYFYVDRSDGFTKLYKDNSKKAGTYVLTNGNWQLK
jgi:hypothetical protein